MNSKKMKKPSQILIIVALAVILIGILVSVLVFLKFGNKKISSFEECVAAGHPVLEIYPEICKTPDGRSFTRVVDEAPSPDGIDPSSLGGGDQTGCTMEALQCPDGSYVGRTGPNCQFEPCPGE